MAVEMNMLKTEQCSLCLDAPPYDQCLAKEPWACCAYILQLEQRLAEAEKFAHKMFDLSDWPEGGDIDGFDFQDAAVECGLLITETRTEPCEENCHCAEYHGAEAMKEGVTCYRKAKFLLPLMKRRSGSPRTRA